MYLTLLTITAKIDHENKESISYRLDFSLKRKKKSRTPFHNRIICHYALFTIVVKIEPHVKRYDIGDIGYIGGTGARWGE